MKLVKQNSIHMFASSPVDLQLTAHLNNSNKTLILRTLRLGELTVHPEHSAEERNAIQLVSYYGREVVRNWYQTFHTN